ncbi:DotI/IcmL/TraM family protein [Coxiella-like endosymbiont of Rhipicephalus sanguineus]|uniref:DotI/IcmL/TraM family protein n=1 Tax=Coxiella-like endosymbiont of Rhipicephalus sanguineus TaxID=1955402 RepID=UPI00255B264A|nr:DotI/IcmL/TraM family protein [Coxiella-like endosymbiont of Rhipicephalus sanguineus]
MSYLITMVIIGLGLLAVLSCQIMTTEKTTYYATTTTGRIISLQSLDMPVVTKTRIYSNGQHWQRMWLIKVVPSYFTGDGWDSLMDTMK